MSAYRKGLRAKASNHVALVKEFYDKYQARIAKGLAVYGEFDANKDTRVLAHEAIEEILDGCGSYMDMLEQKHPSLQHEIQKIRAKGILLYGELLKLEKDEISLMEAGDDK